MTGNTVACAEGALANGGTFTITLTGTAPSTAGTCFTNTATVTGNEVDNVPGNNSSTSKPAPRILPTITTALSASSAAIGTAVHDSAALGGATTNVAGR